MVNNQTEIWYEIEFTRPGQTDWVLLTGADTLESARAELHEHQEQDQQFVYRIVRKTLTKEIVNQDSRAFTDPIV